MSAPLTEFSGTLVTANKPFQLISGTPCSQVPAGFPACDHVEESVVPAETLGKRYFVAPPTGDSGQATSHVVRLIGNVDGTALTYPGGAPGGAPAFLSAGQTVDLSIIGQAFEVVGDKEFAVVTLLLGASLASQDETMADPSMSIPTPVEQYRRKYVFLAPTDYDVSYADVIGEASAVLTLDDLPVQAAATPLSSGYVIRRIQLAETNGGAHVLISDSPVGLRVIGYGQYTSYQYPGGMNLELIAPPPPVPQ